MEESACKRMSANVRKVILVYAASSVSISGVHFKKSLLLLCVKFNG